MGDGSFRRNMLAAEAARRQQHQAAQDAARANRRAAYMQGQTAENAMERVDKLIVNVLDPTLSAGSMRRGPLVDFDAAPGRHVTISADEGQALVRLTVAAMSAEAGGEAPAKEAVSQRMRVVLGRIAGARNPKLQLAIETEAALTEIEARKKVSQEPKATLAVPVGRHGVTPARLEAAQARVDKAADLLEALQPEVVKELKTDRELSALTLITLAVNPKHPVMTAFIKEAAAPAANDHAQAVVHRLRTKVMPARPAPSLPQNRDRKPFISPEKPPAPEGQKPPGQGQEDLSALVNPADFVNLPPAESVKQHERPVVAGAARRGRDNGMNGVQV